MEQQLGIKTFWIGDLSSILRVTKGKHRDNIEGNIFYIKMSNKKVFCKIFFQNFWYIDEVVILRSERRENFFINKRLKWWSCKMIIFWYLFDSPWNDTIEQLAFWQKDVSEK